MKNKVVLIVALCAISFFSCKKDKYQPKGDYVTSGTNVNTVQQYDFTVYSVDWISNGGGDYYYNYYKPTTMQGAVMVYYNDGIYYTPLPFNISSTQQILYAYQTSGILEIDLLQITPQTLSFRLVVIPPGMKKENINHNNYAEVAHAYNLD